jgi:1-acyl-sn-glycerol-3-phosphate acyltransferase
VTGVVVPRAWLRRQIWRLLLTGTGGLRVDGPAPTGACVVVANHASHADTAALLAALPARGRPVVVAATDYWLKGGRLRRLVCRLLVEIVPVRRGGGGSADLAAAGTALRSGRVVVVFPEGSRSRDGQLGAFHCGPFRLAADNDVPVVPAGICGTRELLPAHGQFAPGPVAVRFGPAIVRPDAEGARGAVQALAAAPPARPDSLVRIRVARLARSRWGVAALAGWAAAEAFSWPIVPEFLVGILVLAVPRRAPVLAVTAVLASTAAGVLALSLAGAGFAFPEPLVTGPMRAQVAREVTAQGPDAVLHQPTSGIPLKAYAATAGRAHVPPGTFAVRTAQSRGLRMLVVAAVLALVGALGQGLRRYYPFLIANAVVIFTVGLAATVRTWS